MGRVYTYSVIVSLILLMLSPMVSQGQNTRHYVQKGETVYQIARKYNVSPKTVLMLNPNASDLIQIGQELIIPEPQFTPTDASAVNTDYELYTVIAGDTKFELSQRFSVSIADLEALNPQMVPTLLADSQIRIPMNQKTESASKSLENQKTHLVSRGETLYGIARQYGITLEQLIDANTERLGKVLLAGQYLEIPQLKSSTQQINGETYLVVKGDTKFGLSKRFNVDIASLESANPSIVPTLMAGDRIIIPDNSLVSSTPESTTGGDNKAPPKPDISTDIVETEPITVETPDNTEDALSESNPISFEINPEKLHILLSFKESDYNKFISSYKGQPVSNNPLTAQQEEMLNYKGILKAIDSLKSMNYSITSTTQFNVTDSLLNASSLNSNNQIFLIPDLDLVLTQVKTLSEESIVVTNSYRDIAPKLKGPVFVSRNQNNSSKDFLLNHLKASGHNLIMISDPTQLDYTAFAKAQHPQLKFLTESNANRIDEKQIESLLSQSKKNFIIFNTDRNGVFINVTNSLLKLSARYDIQTAIVNESFLPDSENVSNTRFKILKMIYPESLYQTIDGSLEKDNNTYNRLVDQGSNTAYDLLRKLRNYQTNGGDILETLKGNKMEQLEYFKASNNRYKTGRFIIKQYN